MVFYGRDARAFALLAADTRRVYGLDGQVMVDRHLPGRGTDPPGGIDAAQVAIIHRAIGWLIDQGLPPDVADRELRRRAATSGRTLIDMAHYLP